MTEQEELERGRPKHREGLVISNKMQKTIVVAVTRRIRHQRYGKFVKKTLKYVAHDEREQAGEGDLVRIVETRPISKTKRWRMQEILVKAE